MKFKLLDSDTVTFSDIKLRRIKYEDGTLGGYLEKEDNLDTSDGARVSENARVYGTARVSGTACVSGNARVSGTARVLGNACVLGNARVLGNACVLGNARVSENARVSGTACVSGNARVYGNACVLGEDKITDTVSTITELLEFDFTISKKDKRIRVGCKSHTFEEWKYYIENDNESYIRDCESIESHINLVNMIEKIMEL